MIDPTKKNARGSLKARLYAEHVKLDALFKEVMMLLERNDREQTTAAWTMFESGLVAHMDMEERDIIRAFREAYPLDAAKVLAEHTKFRAKLIELGMAVDLHFVRANVARDFIEALHQHAERENALMYEWADARDTRAEAPR